MIKSGLKLVILDDMVLDISKFIFLHPGGQFSLSQNIGRDISKYFHGGYSLENRDLVKNHMHSSDARRIVNSLIIGRLIEKAPEQIMSIAEEEGKANQSGSCVTFKFKSVNKVVTDTSQDNLLGDKNDEQGQLCPLRDFSQIGRHYVLKSTSHPKTIGGPSEPTTFDPIKHGIKRHYTECFCRRAVVYENLLKIAQNPINSQDSADVLQ